jgi:RHS repeat-associated protein
VTYGYDGAALTCPTPIGIEGSGINGIGRRTAMCNNAGSESWGYDPMGRIDGENERYANPVPPFSGTVYANGAGWMISTDSQYHYYLNGDLSDVLYPGPKGPPDYEFYTDENAAGQVISAGDIYYSVVNGATYTPAGQLAAAQVGWTDGASNPNLISNTYNSRLQPVQISATSGGTGAAILNLTYNFNLGNGDNGNVIQIVNGKDSNRTQNFLYDPLNRIWQAYTAGPNWGETYSPNVYAAGTAFSAANAGIDPWGNLTNRSGVTGKTGSENALNCASANISNQLNTCYQYDAAGNRTDNGTFVYDAENRLIATAGTSYVYDGNGQRVEKCSEGTTPGTCTSTATGMFYWHSLDGGTLAESDLGGNWTAVYGLIRGLIGSRVDLPANVVHYYFQDHLKSTDVVTAADGTILKESDYYPYGGEIVVSGSDTNRYKFNSKERDAESNLDEFGARYYASTMGRFMTPDWAAKPIDVPYANFGNPQSLNLYSYVENNPTTLGDPDGHMFWAPYVSGGFIGNLTALVGQGAQSELGQGVSYFGTLADEGEAAQAAASQSAQAQNQSNNSTGYGAQNQAATAALDKANPNSIRINKEEAGLIYKDSDGHYHYTGPVVGTDAGSNPHDAKAPRDSTVVGDYHTHGDYSVVGPDGKAVRTHDPHRDDYNSDHFSGQDKTGIAHDATGKPEYRGYLGTPSGKFLIYSPTTGQEGPLQ